MLQKWTVFLSAIVLLMGIALLPVSAQDGGPQPGWTTYTGKDGVPYPEDREGFTRIMTVAVAPDHTVWVGTLDGLAHFDGEIWTTYTEEDGLASNCIVSVSFAPDGLVWVAASSYSPAYDPLCTQGGVSRFDGESWITYTKEDGLTAVGEVYTAIATTPDGLVWVGHRNGILQFDGTSWSGVKPGASVASMAAAPDGTLWVGGGNPFECREFWLSHFDGTTWTTFTQDDGLLGGCITSIAVAPGGTVWAVASSDSRWETQRGVSRFDGETWTTLTDEDHPALDEADTVAIAPNGTVWIATWDHGVLQFDGETWTRFTTEDGLAGNMTTSVAVAPDSTVWIGTLSGVSRYVPPR
jgi:ligand-binding sensor domain-containing protein